MKSDVPYLDEILKAIALAREFTRGGRDEFETSQLVQFATLRAPQVMAESTKRLSEERKRTHPDVPWRRIADFRNVLVHEYARVNVEQVWRVLEDEIPALERAVSAMRATPAMAPAPREPTRVDP